ncbi:MAG: hypothetical protein AAFY20_04720 [Cyanobacteria bacterium J06639_14]
MSRRYQQSASRISTIPIALVVLVGVSLGILQPAAASTQDSETRASEEWLVSDNSVNASDVPEAPSPWWLVVMPAIPLMGGGLIYTKRRFFGAGLERQERSSADPDSQPDVTSSQTQSEEPDQG